MKVEFPDSECYECPGFKSCEGSFDLIQRLESTAEESGKLIVQSRVACKAKDKRRIDRCYLTYSPPVTRGVDLQQDLAEAYPTALNKRRTDRSLQ
jgi:hypothetical protein